MTRRTPLGRALSTAAGCALLSCSVITGCGSSKISTTPASSPAVSVSATPAATGPSPSSSAAVPAQAQIGDTLELAGNDSGERMAVTVASVVDPASAGDQYFSPSPGHRLVAVQFRLRNIGTTVYSDSPSNGAEVIDSQGQGFNASLDTTTAGPSFPAGVHIAPGDAALGFITFDVPSGSAVTKVQFTLNSGFANQTGQWVVHRSPQPPSAQPASPPSVATATVTVGGTTTAPAAAGPAQVVEDYFAAINSHDYARAWALGGKNLGTSYSAFVSGFAGTALDTVTVLGVNGGTVTISLDAAQTDGSHRFFAGTYTVRNGTITGASIGRSG